VFRMGSKIEMECGSRSYNRHLNDKKRINRQKQTYSSTSSHKKIPMSFSASSSEDLESATPWFDDMETELFVQSVPKVELHVHLDGSFSPKELWEHLQQNPDLMQCIPVEKKLPWETKPDAAPFKLRELVSGCNSDLDYTRLCTCRRRYRKTRHTEERKKSLHRKVGSLEDMLLCFEFFLPLVHNNFQLLENLAFDFVKRQREQNVIYTEVRYSPHLLAKDPRKAHQAITKGLRRGCLELSTISGVCIVNQILCGIDFQPEWSADVVDMAHEFRHDFPCAVVGVDVAAGESHFAPNSPFHNAHLNMCRKAGELGVPVTLHAGESPNSERNVGVAILQYGAKRIGHGYRVSLQDGTIELAKSKNIHFENCPTSSVVSPNWLVMCICARLFEKWTRSKDREPVLIPFQAKHQPVCRIFLSDFSSPVWFFHTLRRKPVPGSKQNG